MRKTKISTADVLLCGLFAALLCIASAVTIPIGTIPVTLSIFGVFLVTLTLGVTRGLLSVVCFLLLGICGLPVFSGGGGGIAVLFGPTGGYIWSYPLAVLISACGVRLSTGRKKTFALTITVLFCAFALLPIYFIGTGYYCLVSGTAFVPALSVCVIPFIPFDILKGVAATLIADRIRPLITANKKS